jgi:hypothetical protein
MEIGEKFKHKHYDRYTCQIVAFTNKGFKVLQTDSTIRSEKKRTTIKYYYFSEFENSERGLWIKVQ